MATKRTAEEIQRLLDGYRQRSVTRTEYCRQQGISRMVRKLDSVKEPVPGIPAVWISRRAAALLTYISDRHEVLFT